MQNVFYLIKYVYTIKYFFYVLQLKSQIPVLKKAYLDEQTECNAIKVKLYKS